MKTEKEIQELLEYLKTEKEPEEPGAMDDWPDYFENIRAAIEILEWVQS